MRGPTTALAATDPTYTLAPSPKDERDVAERGAGGRSGRQGAGRALTGSVAGARSRVAANPDLPDGWFELAAALLDAGDPAVDDVLPALGRFTDHAPGWCTLGHALLRTDQAGPARDAYARALASDPRSLPALLGGVAALLALGDAADAVRLAGTAIRTAPGSAAAAHAHARALRAAGDAAGARAAYERLTALDPGRAEAWFHLGSLRADAGDADGAIAALRAALGADERLHEAAFNLGVVLAEARRLDEALGAFGIALRLRPESFGRIAQALVSVDCGVVFLEPALLRRTLEGAGT